MIEISVQALVIRAVYSLFTLYMMLILLRWLAPWIQIDLYSPRLKWVRTITDPLLDQLRKHLPLSGVFDFTPLAAVFVVWVGRTLLVGIMGGFAI